MTTTTTLHGLTDDEIVERAVAIPHIEGFPTVDELLERLEALHRAHPDLLRVRRIGTSRLGEPIPLYTLAVADDEEPRGRALLVGGVHPNEPIGSHTILRLLGDLLDDAPLRQRLGVEWHVIPCADPDGMRLNEGWFADPSDDDRYFRHFHRPAGAEQVEWTFPINLRARYFDAMLPETQALQRAIDDIRPDWYVPLHNSETGGAYFYAHREATSLVPLLHRLPAAVGIPLHLGEPESMHHEIIAPAVFATSSPEAVYAWREANGLDPAPPGGAGQSSTSYARRYGTASLIAELPMWRTFGADDTTQTTTSYATLLRIAASELALTGAALTASLERLGPHLTIDSPFLRSARAFVPMMVQVAAQMAARAEQPEHDRPATVAERPMSVVWMHRLRFGGALLRALQAEVSAGSAPVVVRAAARELEAERMGWLERRRVDEQTQAIPVAAVVGVQYGAVLGFVTHGPYDLGDTEPS